MVRTMIEEKEYHLIKKEFTKLRYVLSKIKLQKFNEDVREGVFIVDGPPKKLMIKNLIE